MDILVEGAELQAAASTLRDFFHRVCDGLLQQEPELAAGRPDVVRIAVPAGEGPHPLLQLQLEEQGATLLVDGPQLLAAFSGDIAPALHAIHRELARLGLQRQLLAAAPPDEASDSEFDRQLQPLCQALWLEYAANRQSVASLPQGADLMLGHVIELLQVLPKAMAEDIGNYYLDPKLDLLAQKALGRVAHLGQSVAHAQGYLAGAGTSLEALNPKLYGEFADTVIAHAWQPQAQALEQIWQHRTPETLVLQLRTLQRPLLAMLSALGLNARRAETGDLWLDIRPLSPETLQHVLGGEGEGETRH